MKKCLLLIVLFLCFRGMAAIHADFTADKFSGCPPLLVNFANTSLPNNLTLRWTFGNGNSSVLTSPSAIFQTSGTYAVKLVVSNGTISDSITKTVTVFSIPVIDFTTPQTSVCQGDTIQIFSNIIQADAPITDYAWDMGNGISRSGTDVKYLYNQSGVYDITLVVQDSNLCSANLTKPAYITIKENPVANFSFSPDTSCNSTELITFTNTSTGNGLTYVWQLDSGVTSTAQHPQYTYHEQVERVTLTATGANGCVDTFKNTVSVVSLISDFDVSKTNVCTGEAISFNNNSNHIGDCFWTFGDGTSSVTEAPTKTYQTPGTYTVTMINRVSAGCTDTIVKVQYITVRQGVVPSFTFNITSPPCSDSAIVQFQNTTPGSGWNYHWTFGDATPQSTATHPTHTYDHNGTFLVSLGFTDTSGCMVAAVVPVVITSQLPVAKFKADTLNCPYGQVRFTNQSTGSNSCLWNFGDGTTSTMRNPIHTYINTGYYRVVLTAFSAGGCDSTVIKPNYIHIVTPQVNFHVNQTYSPCPPLVAVFNSAANRPDMSYVWDFGDGNTDTVQHPTHIYFQPGVYTVKLIGTAANGCSDTVTRVGLIDVQGPTGNFVTNYGNGCLPGMAEFTATLSSNTAAVWFDTGDGALYSDSTHLYYTYTTVDSFLPRYFLVDHTGCVVSYQLPPVVTHPAAEINLGDTVVCRNTSLELALDSNYSYNWLPATYLSCTACDSIEINAASEITYTVSASTDFGCVASDTMHVGVDNLSDIADFPDSVTVCKNSSITLDAGTAAVMNWSPALYLNDSTLTHPVCTPDSSVTYYLTAQSENGCTKQVKIGVEVLDKLELIVSPDLALCPLDTFQLSADVVAAPDNAVVNYHWTPAQLLNSSNIANPQGNYPSANTSFTVIASAGTCASDTGTVLVTLNTAPALQVQEDIVTTPLTHTELTALSSQTLSYQWQGTDSFTCADCHTAVIYPTQSQMVFVTGTTAAGCTVTDSVYIRVVGCHPEMIFLANTFTPNGDGQNDKFYAHSQAIGTLNSFRVFNEWGQMVFVTDDLNQGWDGNVNGHPAACAVYTYLITAKCQNGDDIEKSGSIALMR